MNGLTITLLEPGNGGPDILDADCEQNSVGFERGSVAKADGEQLTRFIDRRIDDTAHELNAEFDALRVTQLAQLGRADALVTEIAADAARLPVARIAGVDDDDLVEIAGEPERGAESGGAAANYCNIVALCRHAGRGCKFDSRHSGLDLT